MSWARRSVRSFSSRAAASTTRSSARFPRRQPRQQRVTAASTEADPSPPVEVRGLVKRYDELVAVDNIDLTVEPGDVFGYLGPNGAGKTTSLRMLLGLIRPSGGSARLFGRDP